MSTPGPLCKPLANKMWSRWLSQQAKWHFAGKWYFPNQISPVSLFEYVLNRQLHVWEKPSDKEKKKKKNFFQRTFLNDGKTTNSCHSQTLNAMFLFSLSEHSQVLTFFGPGFALLYAITYVVLHSNVKFWKT